MYVCFTDKIQSKEKQKQRKTKKSIIDCYRVCWTIGTRDSWGYLWKWKRGCILLSVIPANNVQLYSPLRDLMFFCEGNFLLQVPRHQTIS